MIQAGLATARPSFSADAIPDEALGLRITSSACLCYDRCMDSSRPSNFTAVIQRDGEWWIGWIEEVPGVNSQGETRDELVENLRSALSEAIEMNRADARSAAKGAYEEEAIHV